MLGSKGADPNILKNMLHLKMWKNPLFHNIHERFQMQNHHGDELKIRNSKKVEFILERQTIEQRLSCGHESKAIWKALRATGRVSMSYEWFLILVRRYLPNVGGAARQLSSISSETSRVAAGRQSHPSQQINSGNNKSRDLTQTKQREPLMSWSEEKPRREINLCTIGKEYLIERYKEGNNDEESKSSKTGNSDKHARS